LHLPQCATGQGKLGADGKTWLPLATGELLLGYADEAGECPSRRSHIFAMNGPSWCTETPPEVGTFRKFLNHWSERYGSGRVREREAGGKFVGAGGWNTDRALA